MPDDFTVPVLQRLPVPGRPLGGLTILVVEDSRLACDAIRQYCVRAGARIRRADCIRAARRHIQTYRPSVVLCDVGLPDGSGLEFLADLARSPHRPPALICMTGDPDIAARSLDFGADTFLLKPIGGLGAFSAAILGALSLTGTVPPPAAPADAATKPDPAAFRDDLSHAARVLAEAPDAASVGYVAGFLQGVARIARDASLERAAADLAARDRAGVSTRQDVRRLAGLVSDRISTGGIL